MFERNKLYFFDYYKSIGLNKQYIVHNKIHCFETEFKKDENNVFQLFEFLQFCDDGSIYLLTSFDRLAFLTDYIIRYKDKLFSNEAYECLYNYITELSEKNNWAFYPPRNNNFFGIYYGIDHISKLNKGKIQSSTVCFNNETVFDVIGSEDRNFPCEKNNWCECSNIFYGSLIDGKIVSVASCNSFTDPCKMQIADIGINTHENYRQKGYATSNVAALTEFLLRGEACEQIPEVRYSTNSNNIQSQRTALSAGFIEMAKLRSFCYKQN